MGVPARGAKLTLMQRGTIYVDILDLNFNSILLEIIGQIKMKSRLGLDRILLMNWI